LPDSTGAPTPGRTRTPPCAPACPDTNQYDLAADTRAYALPDGTSRAADKLQHKKTPHHYAPLSYQPVVPAVDNNLPTADLSEQPAKRTTTDHLSVMRTGDLASILLCRFLGRSFGPLQGRETDAIGALYGYLTTTAVSLT
jgi:hypothetical protein